MLRPLCGVIIALSFLTGGLLINICQLLSCPLYWLHRRSYRAVQQWYAGEGRVGAKKRVVGWVFVAIRVAARGVGDDRCSSGDCAVGRRAFRRSALLIGGEFGGRIYAMTFHPVHGG